MEISHLDLDVRTCISPSVISSPLGIRSFVSCKNLLSLWVSDIEEEDAQLNRGSCQFFGYPGSWWTIDKQPMSTRRRITQHTAILHLLSKLFVISPTPVSLWRRIRHHQVLFGLQL